MTDIFFPSLAADIVVEHWPLAEPFAIAGRVFASIDTVLVTLSVGGAVGHGEAAGVYYLDDRPADMPICFAAIRDRLEQGISRSALRTLLPPSGLRNAIDCALWDLEARMTGISAAQRAGLDAVAPLTTTFSCGAGPAADMAALACRYAEAQAIKLKLTGDPVDAERVVAVRAARPDVWLSVDANQGFNRATFEALLPTLIACDISLVEQPFARGDDHLLDGLDCPIPIAADESAQSIGDLEGLVGRFQMVNLKLDKSGGLTEALAMAHRARELGLDLMVGNMFGTSLAMAPACLVGQLCSVCDLDGPRFFTRDRALTASYAGGRIACPPALWGAAEDAVAAS